MFYLVFTFITKIQQLWFLRPRTTKAREKLRQGYFLHPHYSFCPVFIKNVERGRIERGIRANRNRNPNLSKPGHNLAF